MKPTLDFTTIAVRYAPVGEISPLPDLMGSFNIQNKAKFFLDEDDEIYEGYGKLQNGFPYRHQCCYSREVKSSELKAAVLENDYLKATFLPELGGRLWSLIDKTTGQNLLYTNDVIRPSNLAIRDAWFSGGVEWNISMIGHSPLTCEPLFTALLADDKGNPVLRMYEYERVRDVEYQMDFWLGVQDRFLNCRMRIVNSTGRVVPMYWWSNMAVPEYEGGRVAVPAQTAYTNRADGIHKVSVPLVDGVDVSRYKEIPNQVDYFFNIPRENDKYIANINAEGYGLLHISTSRLQSRKLFSWGKNDGSDRWQEFLTDKAGRYLEIQAGLGKTQYGCLPMAPHTAWEWIERYGAVQLGEGAQELPFAQLCNKVGAIAAAELTVQQTEELLKTSRSWAKSKGTLVYKGSGYGALANLCHAAEGENALSEHLDFGGYGDKQSVWAELLQSGVLRELPEEQYPEDFTNSDLLFNKLLETADTLNAGNWYAQYQLGVMLLWRGCDSDAAKRLQASLKLKETPWAYHGMAVLAAREGKLRAAADCMLAGLALLPRNLAYIKQAFRILCAAGCGKELAACYEGLPKDLQDEGRLKFYYIRALQMTGRSQQGYALLTAGDGVEIADLREGEESIGELWKALHSELFAEDAPVPHRFNFSSL